MRIIFNANVGAEIAPRAKPVTQSAVNLQSRKLAIALGGPLTRALIQGGMNNRWAELERHRLVRRSDNVE